MTANMQKLLDFEKPLDVALLDATVNSFYTSTNQNEVRFLLSLTHTHTPFCYFPCVNGERCVSQAWWW